MTDPRKLPPDLSSTDWDKLLDDFEAPTEQAPSSARPANPVPEMVVPPTHNPSTAQTKRPPPGHEERMARGGPPLGPPGAISPPRVPSFGTVKLRASDDEEESTVVGTVPRELLADASGEGGFGGGQDGLFDALLDELGRPSPGRGPGVKVSSSEDDLSVMTSAAELMQSASGTTGEWDAPRAGARPSAPEGEAPDPFADLRAMSEQETARKAGPPAVTRGGVPPLPSAGPPPLPGGAPRPAGAAQTSPRVPAASPRANTPQPPLVSARPGAPQPSVAPARPSAPQAALPQARPSAPQARPSAPQAPPPSSRPSAPQSARPVPPPLPSPAAPLVAPTVSPRISPSLPPGAKLMAGPKLLEPDSRSFSSEERTFVGETTALPGASAPSLRPPLETLQESTEVSIEASESDDDDALYVRDEEALSVPDDESGSRPDGLEAAAREGAGGRFSVSLAPPAIAGPPEPTWADERDAREHLAERDRLDEWLARAAWLELEARARDDRAERGRMLLTVSELVAMAGDAERAGALASEARELAPNNPLAHRQARAGLAREGAFEELLVPLENETRFAPTPAGRAHGAILAAEIARVVTGDVEGATKRYEQASRAVPADPRPHVTRVAAQLAEGGAVKYRWPDAPALSPLVEGLAGLGALRGAAERGAPPRTPLEALSRARASLAAGDVAAVCESLAVLARVRAVGDGALWLAASLAAPASETRRASLGWLRVLQDGAHPVLASRTLAARAFEVGDRETARELVHLGRTFDDAEQAAFDALDGAPLEVAAPAVMGASERKALVPLAAAVEAFLGGGRSGAAGDAEAQAYIALGRALGAGANDDLEGRILDVLAATVDAPVARALELDEQVARGAADEVASALAAWRAGPGQGAEFERDRALAASLLYEVAGDAARAASAAGRASLIDAHAEAPVRVRLALEGEGALDALEQLADATDDPTRKASLLLEVAARRQRSSGSVERGLLEKAFAAAPELPFAPAMGARAARMTGDVEAVVDWVKRRREASDDPVEEAHDLVREALLVINLEGGGERAADLLERAGRARPGDVALRDLLERVAPEPPQDRARWLAERSAAAATPSEASRAALSAAWEHELRGEYAEASAMAERAVEKGASELARLTRDRADSFGPGAARLAEELMARAREATDPTSEREAYERLAFLDEIGRGDTASALLWHRSILEKDPSWLPSLRRLEHTLIGEGREDELEPVFVEIAKATRSAEVTAHARVAARLRLRQQTWEDTRELVSLAASVEAPSLWALRQSFAHALAAGDDERARQHAEALAARTDRPAEASSLTPGGAGAAVNAGSPAEAAVGAERALELDPDNGFARLVAADALVRTGDFPRAALALETAAAASRVPAHQARLYYEAAIVWLDHVGDRTRGGAALEEVNARDVAYADAFARLQTLYIELGERQKLAALLERRLAGVSDPAQRVELEVTRGRALADVGDVDAAKAALSAALEASPDHLDALRAFADVCVKDGDWAGAEQAFIRLARLIASPDEQAELYLRLGDLYDAKIPNAERAEAAYREVLKRRPGDTAASERLVALFSQSGDLARALETQQALLAAAKDPAEKRRRLVDLARLYETVGNDARKAESTLESLRKEFPQDTYVLRALAEFHQRNDHGPALNMLLDRAAADARRALSTGRFDLHFFANLATVFDLRGRRDSALVAQGTLAALEGRPGQVPGVGARGVRPDLDDFLAPEIFTPAFRALLRTAGDALDAAMAVDLRALRAAPLPEGPAAQSLQDMAMHFGFPHVQAYLSPTLGAVCVPVQSNPPTVVVGAPLLGEHFDAVRPFIFLRALKVVQARVAPFARTAPIELWPLVAAFLKTFNPSFEPQGVDQNKLAEYRTRLQRSMPTAVGNDAPVLALEVTGSLGNRASTLQTAANAWGNRCSLLALGDLSIGLSAIAAIAGVANGPPPGGPERLTWVGRNAEARDLVIFSVSDAYSEARVKA